MDDTNTLQRSETIGMAEELFDEKEGTATAMDQSGLPDVGLWGGASLRQPERSRQNGRWQDSVSVRRETSSSMRHRDLNKSAVVSPRHGFERPLNPVQLERKDVDSECTMTSASPECEIQR